MQQNVVKKKKKKGKEKKSIRLTTTKASVVNMNYATKCDTEIKSMRQTRS